MTDSVSLVAGQRIALAARLHRSRRWALSAALLVAPALAQEPSDQQADLLRRLDMQEARIRELETRLDAPPAAATQRGPFEFTYDDGYVLRSTDPERSPFSLRINGRMQFRYTGFSPDDRTFENLGTAASGEPITVTSLNDFEIERGRLEFTGTWLDPDLHFYINLDADTDDEHATIFHDFWFDYEFDEAFHLYVGKAFVPGSRDWINGSTRTHFADRSMATTYFRPDRSLGIWAIGEPVEDFHYRAMIANGFATSDVPPDLINDEFAYSGTVWWDPLAGFGKGYADLEMHDEVALQVGSSFTFAQESGLDDNNSPVLESRFLRISDGTRLTSLGVDEYDVYLLAADAALKYEGFSIHGEGFYRWVRNVSPIGSAPSMFPQGAFEDWGFYVDAGMMVVPKKIEPIVRVSTVQGDQKDSWEYALGVNWYVDGTHKNKLVADATWLDGSPASNRGPNYRLGDDGVMFRVQWQVAF
ncbi:MAG: hypothetical protein IPM29_04910 [Planctomycetes bacterium]|nr:hypothetical protein [Planctomycetota bacterium]